MQLLEESGIATWHESYTDIPAVSQEIATETRPTEDPDWEKCIDALLKLLRDKPEQVDDFVPPNQLTIWDALRFLQSYRQQNPFAPPTMIVPEPGGGLIIERRYTSTDGIKYIEEVTFYNDSPPEFTFYRNGKILFMKQAG